MHKEKTDLRDRTKGFELRIVRMFSAPLNSAFSIQPWKVMVEGIKVGATAEETTADAHADREFLERLLAPIQG
jgi:hypothetical protein